MDEDEGYHDVEKREKEMESIKAIISNLIKILSRLTMRKLFCSIVNAHVKVFSIWVHFFASSYPIAFSRILKVNK